MSLLNLHYNGNLEDLKSEINKIEKMFGSFNVYRSSINEIKRDLYPNFEKYKNYGTIYIGKIIIKNSSISGLSFHYHSSEEDLKPGNKPLYNWSYTLILLWIILLLFVLFICVFIYCYIYEMDIYLFFNHNINHIYFL